MKTKKPDSKLAQKTTLCFVAPSGPIPKLEFKANLKTIESRGFKVKVHPQVYKTHLFFAGKDQVRAQAFYEAAMDPEVDVVWAARGGYGAIRLLPHLEKCVRQHGIPPRKLFVGFSDSTVLLDYLASRWGWKVLHAPMPGLRAFSELPEIFWTPLEAYLRGELPKNPWGKLKLEWLTPAPKKTLLGEMTGGNLCVLASLVGTPYMPKLYGKFLLLEETTETLYRIDRMVEQLKQSGSLCGVKAILLGTFDQCEDRVPQTASGPLRALLSPDQGLEAIFGAVGREFGIPVARGLPTGHASLKIAGGSFLLGNALYELGSKGLVLK